MADNNERSRADELFDVLQSLNGEGAQPENTKSPEKLSIAEGGSRVDDIMEILSSNGDLGAENADSADVASETEEEPELPSALFGHLTDENEISGTTSEARPHFTDHISDETESVAEPAEEPEPETEPKNNKTLNVIKKIFQQLSIVPKAIIYLALVIAVSAYLSYYIITIGNDVFALVSDTREVTITIEDDADHESVAQLLKENNIIEYDWVYELYMKYRGDGDSSNEYIAGDYTLNTNYNYSQIITVLTANNVKREVVKVTIPEGFTIDQIIDLLVESGVGQREDYIAAINDYEYKWEFVRLLDEKGYSEHRKYRLEGYLYPDTYEFFTTESEVYVINKMLNAFNDKFWKEFTRVNIKGESYQKTMLEKYGLDFDDIVVLASIVQSEGGTVEDFYAISYVFHNRLSHPQSFPKLESDATIQYALPERISDSTQLDVSFDTPYNTYLYNGLPPGAISNPGLDALNAALFPTAPTTASGATINAYFFVSNNAGKTYYASSKSGHDNNVAQAKRDNEAIKAGTYE